MVVVNQHLEDDNNHGSEGITSLIDEIARVNASKETEMERVIHLYLEDMWPTVHVNFEEDNNHGAGGSTSSIDTVFASTKLEKERQRVIRICKETLWPMIRAEINVKQQNILLAIKEKYGLDLLTDRTWNSGNRASTSGSPVFQFKFLNGISTTVSTGKNIEGKDDKPFVVALVDQNSGQIVRTGAESATEIEITVLEGDCNDVETENWTRDDFNSKIIREWSGKKVLQGNTFLKLKQGIVYVNKISFTHNSTWKGKRLCRLGVRSVDAVFATRVKEAKTESFLIRDKRSLKYNKHEIPLLSDNVYRINGINHRSDCFKRLREANIKTVMDLRTLCAINPDRLKDILKVHPNEWKSIMDHAKLCKDDNGIYLYHHSRDDQKRDGVVFNIFGHLVGLVTNSQFLPCDRLSNDKKVSPPPISWLLGVGRSLIIGRKERDSRSQDDIWVISKEASIESYDGDWDVVMELKTQNGDVLDFCVEFLDNQVDAQKVVVSASEHWEELLPFNDETSLINHLQSRSRTNFISFPNPLNLVIPQTSLITPISPTNNDSKINIIAGVTPTGQLSQSPKRPASSEHDISNSPKKPRENQSLVMPNASTSRMTNTSSTSDVINDDNEYLKYLNLSEFGIYAQKWKRVWCVVGWISIFSKIRSRHQLLPTSDNDTLMVITASVEHVQI